MALFSLSLDAPPPPACRGGVLTIGNFDGVHRGHQALVRQARSLAERHAVPAVAVTFDPHPLQLLRPDAFQPMLTTLDHRAALLQEHGADHVVVIRTSTDFLALTDREFFDRIVLDELQARGLVEGRNFCFGRDRAGTAATLEKYGAAAGIEVVLVDAVQQGDAPVSSSRVRTALLAGEVAAAAHLLGRPYRIEGTVAAGQERGRLLGFPTANLHQIPTLVPGDGVFAGLVHFQGRPWTAAMNIGPNPTFAEHGRKVEVHLLDFTGNLYGQRLVVDFLARIRPTRPFASVDDLVAQIKRDVDEVRRLAHG